MSSTWCLGYNLVSEKGPYHLVTAYKLLKAPYKALVELSKTFQCSS